MRRELDRSRIISVGERGGGGVTVPAVYFVDEARGEIYMEWITGQTLREVLDQALLHTTPLTSSPPACPSTQQDLLYLMTRIGSAIAAMHAVHVIHGDLTTSNIMIRAPPPGAPGDGELVLIDFGLGAVSASDEDMAVDLYVLERAFISTHPRAEEMFKEVLVGYEKGMGKKGAQVMRRLAEVRFRGRKRSMLG